MPEKSSFDYETPPEEQNPRENPIYIITPASEKTRAQKKRLIEAAKVSEALLLGSELDVVSVFVGDTLEENELLRKLHIRSDGEVLRVNSGRKIQEKLRFVGKIGREGEHRFTQESFSFKHIHLIDEEEDDVDAFATFQLLKDKLGLGATFDFSSGESGNVLVVSRNTLERLEGEDYDALRNAQTVDPFMGERIQQKGSSGKNKPIMGYLSIPFASLVNDVTKMLNSRYYLIR